MKKMLLLIMLFAAFNIYAQFNTVIFSKQMYLLYTGKNVYALGDQNDDGYDDILVHDCNYKKVLIFFGGNPMDTIPEFEFNFIMYQYIFITPIDINDDGKKDIVIVTHENNQDVGKINIYYGGALLDTISDIVFNPPEGASNLFGLTTVLQDYNGDGRDEFVIYDINLPNSDLQYGTYYIYNTQTQFDTIPHVIFKGDTTNLKKLFLITSTGDINGDGKGDFTIYGHIDEPPYRVFRNFYIGNAEWNMEPAITFFRDEHSFDAFSMEIIQDINGDGKDDILVPAFGNVYPYWYGNSILYGSFPIDTLQDVGLNTQNSAIHYVTKVGDVNGDGFNDLFAQDGFGYLNAKIWVGGRNMKETPARVWWGGEDGMGRRIAGVGDVDGDGVNDISINKISYSGYGSCKLGTLFIFKGDTSVIGDTTMDVENYNAIEKGYYLEDPYPNPFNPGIKISYYIPIPAFIKLQVYDILGKEITTLVNSEKPAGHYKVIFNANKYNLSSGTYLVQLLVINSKGRRWKDVKKIVLTK